MPLRHIPLSLFFGDQALAARLKALEPLAIKSFSIACLETDATPFTTFVVAEHAATGDSEAGPILQSENESGE